MIRSRCPQSLLCGIFLCSGVLGKTQQVLQGLVLDDHAVPVVNASIKLKDSAKSLPRSFAISNQTGLYRLTLPANRKTVWIECSLLGYRTISFLYTIPSIDKATIFSKNIILPADTASLPEINVFATPPVSIQGDTTTFRVEVFKTGNESNVGELLNAVPGFSVNNGRISYNGKPVNTVMIEDEDLFGSDYYTITQNLSPKGIEKIQLIQNYNDKTYLGNRLTKGDGLAVNLKFSKKHLYRIIASNEAGASISPVADFYKIRQNLVSLIPKLRSVTTTNFNNTGLLATELLGTAFNIPQLQMYKKDGISFDLSSGFAAGVVEQLPDISSSVIPKNRMAANYTSVITNNGLYRASKKIQVKSIFQYYRDTYRQYQVQTQDYSASGINFLVSNTQFLKKQIPVLNASVETVYSPSAFTQLVYKANVSTQDQTDSLNDFRQLTKTFTSMNSRSLRFQQQLGFSFGIDSNHIIDIRGWHSTGNTRQLPSIYPAGLYTAFTADTNFISIGSFIENSSTEYMFQAKITGRSKLHSWSLELLHGVGSLGLYSDITLIKNDVQKKIIADSLRNDALFKTNSSAIVLAYNTVILKKILLRSTHRFEKGNLSFSDHHKGGVGKSYANYLPSIHFNYPIKQNSSLSVGMEFRNKLPQIYNLSGGYIFANAASITRGAGDMQTGISRSLALTYSFADMVKHKVYLFMGFNYSREPVLYLPNTLPGDFYTVRTGTPYRANLEMLSLFSSISKYVPGIKSQLSFDVQTSRFSSYYSVNNMVGTIAFSNISPGIKCKTLVTDQLVAGISGKLSFLKQDFDRGSLFQRKNTSLVSQYISEFVYRINTKWTLHAKYQYMVQQQAAQTYSLHLGDMSLKYIAIKDKLHFTLSGNNLLGASRLSSVSFTQYAINTQSIDMLRSYLMLHATLEL